MVYRIKAIDEYSEFELSEVYDALSIKQKKYIDAKSLKGKRQSLSARRLLADILGLNILSLINFDDNNRPEKLHDGTHFSFSHSDKYVAVAVSENSVGIDIQKHKKVSLCLIEKVCAPDEILYAEVMETNFFKLWTAKEAFVKAFDVSSADAKKVSFVKDKNLITDIFGHRIVYGSLEDYSYTVIFSDKTI